MSTMSPHDVTDLAEQLAALDRKPPSDRRHASVNQALRMAATTTLREIDAALARMAEGRYGWCATCSQPLPDGRLDVLPMARLCMSCQYNEQNCRIGGGPM